MHGYIYIYICKYMYIYVYVYIYAYAHMYIYISTTRACAPVQRCRSFLAMEAIANLSWVLWEHRAGCRFHPPSPASSSSRPPSCWPIARHVRLRNPIKSTLAHDAVAAVVLHKHHLIIRVGAGLIEFVYGSHSRLAADLTLDKNLFSLPFSRLRQGRSRDASASGRTGHAVLLQEATSSNCHDARVVQGWADCCLHCSQVCTRMLSRLW